jgi:hypothetical protein
MASEEAITDPENTLHAPAPPPNDLLCSGPRVRTVLGKLSGYWASFASCLESLRFG